LRHGVRLGLTIGWVKVGGTNAYKQPKTFEKISWGLGAWVRNPLAEPMNRHISTTDEVDFTQFWSLIYFGP